MVFVPFIKQKVRIIDRCVLPAQAAPALNQIHHFMYVTSQILITAMSGNGVSCTTAAAPLRAMVEFVL